ncbi:hypothetical protein KPL71_008137 [Citrus sinensis]|uniref:Uncharacterized protein n=1 Tax=Citrus sinensis TaxID=2711 RepID=A0ACB8M4L3_CITSI|nr:hypothetical protein KPL71_008137 [Citrus sinensis]
MQQIYQDLQSRISQLDVDLRVMLSQRYYGLEFDQKEREIRWLKAELDQIESEKHRPTLFTKSTPMPTISPTYHPFSPMLAPMKPYDPSKLFGMTHTLLKNMPQPPKPKPKPQPRPIKIHQPTSTTTQQQDSPEHTLVFTPQPSQSKDKEPMHQYASHHIEVSTDFTETDTSVTESDTKSSLSTTNSEGAYADITKLLMAQPEETEPAQPSQPESYFEIPLDIDEPAEFSTHQPPQPQAQNTYKPSNGPWFTFDDIPTVKWREKFSEMSAWVDLQMIRSGATIELVLKEFVTCFTGSLRDWFGSLGPYRQLQFVQLPNVSSALAILHEQFIGEPSVVFEAARRDYLNMKCCSLNTKDLDFHYKRMSIMFYKLNGFNDHTLKHVFLASLPTELQPEIQRQLAVHNLNHDNISLGKIFQIAKGCLEKLFIHEKGISRRSGIQLPFLNQSLRNGRNHRDSSEKDISLPVNRAGKKSSRCFIYGKKGHYAKDCPNIKEKAIILVNHLQAVTEYSTEKEEVESYFSEQEDLTDETMFAMEKSYDDSENDEFQSIFHQQSLSLNTTIPIPSIKLKSYLQSFIGLY